VDPHTDNTYLITNPMSTVGIWIALEDATMDNGCLWGVPGSHNTKTTKFFRRNSTNTATEIVEEEGVQKDLSETGGVPLEATKGNL